MTGEEKVEVPTTVEVEFHGEAVATGIRNCIMSFGEFWQKTTGPKSMPAKTVEMSEKKAWKMMHLVKVGLIRGKWTFKAKPDGRKFAGKAKHTMKATAESMKDRLDAKGAYEKALNDRKVKPEQVEILKKAWEATAVPAPMKGAPPESVPKTTEKVSK